MEHEQGEQLGHHGQQGQEEHEQLGDLCNKNGRGALKNCLSPNALLLYNKLFMLKFSSYYY